MIVFGWIFGLICLTVGLGGLFVCKLFETVTAVDTSYLSTLSLYEEKVKERSPNNKKIIIWLRVIAGIGCSVLIYLF